MLDRLRLFLNRPLTDADRPRLFGLAVAVILLAALALTVLRDEGQAPQATRRAADRATSAQPASTEPAAAAAEAPSEEGEPPDALAASRADVAEAKGAARRFLAGYLPYSYGRRRPDDIRAVSPQLRAELASERPRAPAGARHRRPRIVLLQAEGAGREHAGILALVDDGQRRYTVPLELARLEAGWRVTNVGS